MKKIIFGVVVIFSIVGCSKTVDVVVDKPVVNEEKVEVEKTEVVKVDEQKLKIDEVLPSFSKENIADYGLRTVFVSAENTQENGDKEYYFEPFKVKFNVPAKYSQYYVMDTISGMRDDSSVDFLTKEDFETPPVVDAANSMITFYRMNDVRYEEFKKNIGSENVIEEKDIKIGEFDLHMYVYESFGSRKIYNYVLKNGDYYYDFNAPESKKEFIEEVIKSIKF